MVKGDVGAHPALARANGKVVGASGVKQGDRGRGQKLLGRDIEVAVGGDVLHETVEEVVENRRLLVPLKLVDVKIDARHDKLDRADGLFTSKSMNGGTGRGLEHGRTFVCAFMMTTPVTHNRGNEIWSRKRVRGCALYLEREGKVSEWQRRSGRSCLHHVGPDGDSSVWIWVSARSKPEPSGTGRTVCLVDGLTSFKRFPPHNVRRFERGGSHETQQKDSKGED